MDWCEHSRAAFSEFSCTPRKHIFFMPGGEARVRAGYAHDWELIDAKNKKRFWDAYRAGYFKDVSCAKSADARGE